MAKRRRNRNKPNLPDNVLARARQNAGIEDTETTDGAVEEKATDSVGVVERAARRRQLSPVQLERSRKRGELTNELIEQALHNPTDIVSEEQLSQEYAHVLVDLRNMGILAAILVAVMIVFAFTLPTF